MKTFNSETKLVKVKQCTMSGALSKTKPVLTFRVDVDSKLTDKCLVWCKTGTMYVMRNDSGKYLSREDVKTPGVSISLYLFDRIGMVPILGEDGVHDFIKSNRVGPELDVTINYSSIGEFSKKVKMLNPPTPKGPRPVSNKQKAMADVHLDSEKFDKGTVGVSEAVILDVNLTTDKCNPSGEQYTIIIDPQYSYLTEGKALFTLMPNKTLIAIMNPEGFYYIRPGKQIGASWSSVMYGKTRMLRIDKNDTEDYQLATFKPSTGKEKPILLLDATCSEIANEENKDHPIVDILHVGSISSLDKTECKHILKNLRIGSPHTETLLEHLDNLNLKDADPDGSYDESWEEYDASDEENTDGGDVEGSDASDRSSADDDSDGSDGSDSSDDSDASDYSSADDDSDGSDGSDSSDDSDGSDGSDSLDEADLMYDSYSVYEMFRILRLNNINIPWTPSSSNNATVRESFRENFKTLSFTGVSPEASEGASIDDLAKEIGLDTETSSTDSIGRCDCFKTIHEICFSKKQAFEYATSPTDISEFKTIHGMSFSLFELRAMFIEIHQ